MSALVRIKPEELKLLSNPEALAYLRKYEKLARELSGTVPLLASRVIEYLSKFSKMPPDNARSLREKLESMGFKEETIVMIVNTCPKSVDELRSLLELEEKVYETGTLEEVLKLLSEYCVESK
ncbi:MAG: RNA polymerase Rpb4 [Desulfurococcaceae archaeon]